MWQRYNGTTKIFEKSTDNGVNWSALDLDVAILTQGALAKARQHAQTAYLDAANVFTLAGNKFNEVLEVAKGAKFPAVQVASADANTIDDYEEGTWTPELVSAGGGSVTYNDRFGSYTKIGRFVQLSCFIYVNVDSLNAGLLSITGFPFSQIATHYGLLVSPYWSGLGASMGMLSGYIVPGQTTIQLVGVGAPSTGVNSFSDSGIVNGSLFHLTGHMLAA